MQFQLNIAQLLIVFGAFQGVILAFILLTTPRLRKLSNRLLALLLIAIALLNLQNTVQRCPIGDCPGWLVLLPLFSLTLVPISLYLFLYYLIEPAKQLKKTQLLLFIPFLFELGFNVLRLIAVLEEGVQRSWMYGAQNIIEIFAALATILIILDGIRKLKWYEKELLNNYAEVDDKNLNWLRHTMIGGIILTFVWVIIAILDFFPDSFYPVLVYIVWIGLSVLVYWIGYSMIIRQGLLDTSMFAVSEKKNVQKPTNELSSKTEEHYHRLLELMVKEEIYTDPGLNMTVLAGRLDLSNGYVSQIINQKEGKNFFEFINGYRVNNVKAKIIDPAYDHYTLLAMAQDAGFKSKSTFNSVFKRMTGKTPSQYKSQHS